jgi:hypothetical protein
MGLDEKKKKENDDGVCFDVGYWDPRSLTRLSEDAIFAFPLSLRAPALSAWAKKTGC